MTQLVCELDANNNKIINVPEPVDPQDAATKQYVDNNGGGFNPSSAILICGIWIPGPIANNFGFQGGQWVS